jgi:hypothetical protein
MEKGRILSNNAQNSVFQDKNISATAKLTSKIVATVQCRKLLTRE